ncbi:MAG: putative alpha/beta superfamily hydrolase [Paraglaciecola sp.]|jgi:predicted alpha/beta superfamily hydrolase
MTYTVNLSFPYGYSSENCAEISTFYYTDGDLAFPTLAKTVNLLGFARVINPVLLVGIGYPEQTILEWFERRNLDLLPVEFEAPTVYENLTGITPETGKALDFINFIKKQVIPLVESQNCEPKERILAGYSNGGTFANYVLFKHTNVFDKYIIGAQNDEHGLSVVYAYEEEYAERNKDLNKAVHFSVGTEDDENFYYTNQMLLTLSKRNYPNLKMSHHIISGGTHIDSLTEFYQESIITMAPYQKTTN